MRTWRFLVVIPFGGLSLFLVIQGGLLLVRGLLGHNVSEDLGPGFSLVFGGVLLALGGLLGWGTVSAARRSSGLRGWALAMVPLMLIAAVIGLSTGFWAGVLILSSLVLAGTAFKLADRSEDDVRCGP